jgi:diguanylate cyclase (GGDEF)-like protein
MGDEYRTERVQRSLMINEFAHEHDNARRRLPPHAYENPTPKAHPSAADVSSVLGLPADQVTDELLAALVPLLTEMDRLRWELEQAERRLTWREHQADRHSIVPCLTRRAFVREVDTFQAGGDVHGCVAVLHVAGIEALRQFYGLAAGEGALRHICANILGTLRNTDLVGCLGGSEFGILLPGAGEDEAAAKLAEIVTRIKDPDFTWLGQRMPVTPAFGVHALEAGDGGEQALAAADRARRRLG